MRRVTIPMATNVDWEDLALDGSNRLIVADIGDNQAARQELVLYRFPEPDPKGTEAVGDVETLRVRYPPKLGPVDAEALFLCGNHAFLVTKERRTARVFRVALPGNGQAPTAPIVAESLGALQDIGHVTAACLSDDGRHLALLTYFEVVVLDFDKAFAPDLPAMELLTTLGKAPRRRQSIFLGQSEGITFDGLTLIIAAEMGPFPGGQATLWRLTPK